MSISATELEKESENKSLIFDARKPSEYENEQIGRAHVWTPVTVPYLVCRLLLEKKKNKKKKQKKTKKQQQKKQKQLKR